MASSKSIPSSTSCCPRATSSYHKGTHCGPCYICGKEQERYDHFNGLPSDAQMFLQKHMCTTIPGNSCLCRSHRREAQRHRLEPEYIPLWKKGKENVHEAVNKCAYPECVATSDDKKNHNTIKRVPGVI